MPPACLLHDDRPIIVCRPVVPPRFLQQVWLISSANMQEQEADHTHMGGDEQPEGVAEGVAEGLLP